MTRRRRCFLSAARTRLPTSNAAASAFTLKCPRSKRLKIKYKARILSLVKLVANHEPNAKTAAEIVRDNNLATQARITMLVKV